MNSNVIFEFLLIAKPKCQRLLIGFTIILVSVNFVISHKCYVCGPDSENCNQFDPDNVKYIQDCGTGSKGCSLQINDTGSVLVRACEDFAIEDCKIANDIQYCYCRAELCNRYSSDSIETSRPPDDEDAEVEGSGTNEFTSTKTDVTFSYTNRTLLTSVIPTTSSIGSSLNSYIHPIIYYNSCVYLLIFTILLHNYNC